MIESLLVSTGAETDVPLGCTIGMDAAFLSPPGRAVSSSTAQRSGVSPYALTCHRTCQCRSAW